jgi:RimJ/RimL family protein N-acetyltransferase
MALSLEPIPAGDLVLRAYRAADEPALRECFADEAIARWNPGPADGDVSAWWQRRNDWSDGEHASWAVGDAGDDRLLGSVSIFKIDPAQLDAMIGYFVLPAARNLGVARRAVAAAVRYGFDRAGLHRIVLFHAVANAASCRVALGAGFRLEGELRESYRYADGIWQDEHLHARLASDA